MHMKRMKYPNRLESENYECLGTEERNYPFLDAPKSQFPIHFTWGEKDRYRALTRSNVSSIPTHNLNKIK